MKINILFYEPSSGFGGSANALANLINHMDREIFCPIFAIKNYGSQFKKIRDAEFIKLDSYEEPEKITAFSLIAHFTKNVFPEVTKLYFIIRKRKIAFVHTNTSITGGIPAIIAAKLAGVYCFCHFRGMRRLLKRERFFLNWIDKIIVLNRVAYEYFVGISNKNKVSLIYDGIDLTAFNRPEKGLFKKEFHFNSSPLVGVIGRINEGKGQREFVLSAKEALKFKPKMKFVIVGDAKGDTDEYYREVKSLVNNEGLEESVIFTGWRDDIKNIISDLDILVFPSTTFPEGLPNVIIEAMALGKPVVSTNIPGTAEIVDDGITGFLVPPADTAKMAGKIVYLLENPQIATKMGERAIERARESFNIENIAKAIEGLFIKYEKN